MNVPTAGCFWVPIPRLVILKLSSKVPKEMRILRGKKIVVHHCPFGNERLFYGVCYSEKSEKHFVLTIIYAVQMKLVRERM